MRSAWGLGLVLTALMAVGACSDGSPTTATGNAGGSGGVPAGAGVGDSCGATNDCRTGLVCENGACAPSGTTGANQPCTISGECADGLQCVIAGTSGGRCSPAGAGEEGDGCRGDAECAKGLRCNLVGFGAQCQPEGSSDAGKPCTTSADCFAGLACAGGSCAPYPPGAPSFGLPSFQGVECGTPAAGAVRAYFEIPGVSDPAGLEGDFFRLPYPNDVRLTGSGINLAKFPTPGPELLGFDPVQLYVDQVAANERGFGAYPTVLMRFSAEIDFQTFRFDEQTGRNPVRWVDVTPGADELGSSVGLFWFASTGRSNYVCENWMGIRRPQGQPLLPGHTYAVWITTDGKASDGSDIQRSEHLDALLSDTPPSDGVLADAHAKYAPFRDYLADADDASAAEVLNAAVFTVADTIDPMQQLADAVKAAPVPTASSWVKCGAGAASPCPQAEADACTTDNPAFDEYHALVELPIFQQGTAPYLTEGGGIDSSGPVRTEQVCMALTVPKATMPAEGWPLVVYAHGTGGRYTSHVRDEVAGALSSVTTPNGTVQFAVLGIDQVQHGPRRGDSEQSPNDLFFNFANPDAARGNPMQGAADQIALGRFAAALDVTAADTGGDAIKVNPAAITFFGHSQGSTEGSLALPFADEYVAAVLSGNGASLMDSLLNKTEPVNIAAAVPFVLADFDDKGELSGGNMHPVLTLLQHWIDPADPLNFARIAAAEPVTGQAPKHVFQTYGLGDTFSPPVTMATYAQAGRFAQATADSSASTPDDIAGLDPMATPVSGNVTVDMTTVTVAMRQYGPPADRDGHFVVFDVQAANDDATRFLGMAALGETPQVGQ